MSTILLLGKKGQVGWELQRSLAPLGIVHAPTRDDLVPYCGDLDNLDGLAKTIQQLKPDFVVNAAAYTAVDKAEEDINQARKINTEAPGLIANEVAAYGGWLIHYSTDYVFDGEGTDSRTETYQTNPLNVYGQSKRAGEEAIIRSGCRHLIFRTTWVYGLHGHNFIKTILRLAKERDTLSIVADQVGAPTSAELIADLSAHALYRAAEERLSSGIYHLTAAGTTTWYDYAQLIVEKARSLGINLAVKTIEPVLTKHYKTPAQRPLNSRLNTEKLTQALGLVLPDWQSGVLRMLDEYLGN